MDLLIKDAVVLHKGSTFHLQQLDILIAEGKISKIGRNIEPTRPTKTLRGNQLYCTIGLCDIGVHSGEPGFEQRETIQTLTSAALKGGYTALLVFPNTMPVIQTKSNIRFLQNHPERQGVKIFPIGALSSDLKGKDINEYMEMASDGAKAISDGLLPIQDTTLLNRAMLYAGNAGLPLIVHPEDHHLSQGGQMHEGYMSTSLGMKGVPDVAETQMVMRDISMLSYNSGTIIEHGISDRKSVTLINVAKNEGASIASTVAYLNLLHNDEVLHDFDSNFKVKPVLRSEADRLSLIEGVKNHTIDAIVSNHVPLDTEAKDLEFTYAEFGATGLETCFPALVDGLIEELKIEEIVDKLTIGPRQLFDIDIPLIQEGEDAELCVFDTEHEWTYSADNIMSHSHNNPYIGHTFHTKILATIIKEKLFEY